MYTSVNSFSKNFRLLNALVSERFVGSMYARNPRGLGDSLHVRRDFARVAVAGGRGAVGSYQVTAIQAPECLDKVPTVTDLGAREKEVLALGMQIPYAVVILDGRLGRLHAEALKLICECP